MFDVEIDLILRALLSLYVADNLDDATKKVQIVKTRDKQGRGLQMDIRKYWNRNLVRKYSTG